MDARMHESIRTLREYRAIPLGGLMFFIKLFVIALCLAPVYPFERIALESIRKQEWVIAIACTVVAAYALVCAAWYALLREHRHWFRDYWSRNVCGYIARCAYVDRDADRNSRGSLLSCTVMTSRKAWETANGMPALRSLSIAIDLPLGGWCTRARFVRGDGHRFHRLQRWFVRLRGYSGNGMPQVELQHTVSYFGVTERLVVDIEDALTLAHVIEAEPHRVTSVADFIDWNAIRREFGFTEHLRYERRMETV